LSFFFVQKNLEENLPIFKLTLHNVVIVKIGAPKRKRKGKEKRKSGGKSMSKGEKGGIS